MKHRVVIFTPIGARIITTDDVKKFEGMKNAIINPSLEHVKGVPPHFWTRQNGQIVEMSRPRKIARLHKIDYLARLWYGPRKKWPFILGAIGCVILGFATGVFTWKWEIIDWLTNQLHQ